MPSTSVPATGTTFAGFENYRQIVLVTFKRSGRADAKPGRITAWPTGRSMCARIRRPGRSSASATTRMSLWWRAICAASPAVPVVAGEARILPEAEHAHAEAVIAANWSPPMKLLERSLDYSSQLAGIPTAYIEITPTQA